MSTTDYNELLPVITAIQPADVMIPNMPVSVFVQESEDLYHWCRDDRDALINGGIDPVLIDLLPVRAGACRESQSLWIKERNTRQQAEQEWKVMAPQAFGLRNHLLHAFRYAFRKDPVLLGRVDEIAQGDTNSDMVQDLNDLSVLGKANLNQVTAVGVPVEQLDEAANVSDVMGDLLGATNGERSHDRPRQGLHFTKAGGGRNPRMRQVPVLAKSRQAKRIQQRTLETSQPRKSESACTGLNLLN